MIKFMKSWCEGIIVAVVISIIIEMLIPEGNNKKYVKVIVGVFTVFVVLNPIISKLNNKLEIKEIFELENTIQTSSVINNNIKDVYIKGIEENLKSEILEKFGYVVKIANIDVDSKYENIEKIKLEIGEKKEENIVSIKKIEISTENNENKNEFFEMKKYISENYKIEIENIIITK